ncbi:hypothetical protein [Burkholderia multivorans]|uniref:hypothetical protein n=1 Tax=Burkholderia TaxID=32008 RepID=UPI001C223698|nr:hypothetical protein [Burkholderia multivorans]MBU9496227.1 hypothetical protein [Burkholderia multivorans]
MPHDNVLTAAARAAIMDACQSISRSVDALKECHTVDGDWGDDGDAKAFYDAELRLLGRLTALLAPTQQPSGEVKDDPITALLAMHAEVLDQNEYAYFELAYTRRTEWMAWICSNHRDDDPNRKVLARGQGSTPHEACAAAIDAARAQGGDHE